MSLERPDWFLIDLWPRQMPMICIADPIIAEQLTRATAKQPESTPKMKTPDSLRALLGESSVSTAEVRNEFSVNVHRKFLSIDTLVRAERGGKYASDSIHVSRWKI